MTPISPAVQRGAEAGRPDDSKMDHQPFDAVLNGGAYFEETIREKRLNLLVHLAPYSEVLLITGEEGSGKTSLLDRFVTRAGESWRVCRLAATPDTGPEGVLTALDEALSLKIVTPDTDRETLIRRMREGLHAMRHSALVPLLVVDDAHHLSVAVLQLLGALTEPAEGDEKMLSVILFAESGISDTLTAPELETLRSRISHSFDLPPMSEDQTREYIQHCLSAARMDSEGTFTPSVIKFIHVASRGLPGRINDLAREVLQNSRQPAGSQHTAPRKRGGLWRYALAAVAVTVLALGLVYKDRVTLPVDDSGGETPEAGDVRPAPPFQDKVEKGTGGGMQAGQAAVPPRPPGPGSRTDSDVASSGADPGVDSGVDPGADLSAAERSGMTGRIEAPGTEEADIAASGEEEAVGDGSPRAGRSAPPAAATPEPPPETEETAAEAAVATPPVERGGDRGATTDAAAVEAQSQPARISTASQGLKGEAWLRSQDPGAYTVQLLAMSEPKVLAYIERHGLEDDVAVYHTGRDRSLLAVTYGVFESRDAAARNATQLAERLGGGLSPLVRSMGMIQARLAQDAGAPTAPSPRGEEWLLAQDARRYTLQLVAVSGEKARAFVERHDLGGEAALYRTRSGGRELTAVTYGLYEDRAAARRAAGEVGRRLGVSPWPRSLSEIHAAISALRAETPGTP